MKHPRVGLGIALLLVGILVPLIRQAPFVLFIDSEYGEGGWAMAAAFSRLHWGEWLFLVLMAVTGGVFITSGLCNCPVKRAA